MKHQINVDENGLPIYVNLEIISGDLLIKDHNGILIKKTIGNPSIPGSPRNAPFANINEAYSWFLTNSLARRIDTESPLGEEE